MSASAPVWGADSSDNNALDVARLESEGYRTLIQRRTGGIDVIRGARVPYLDTRFKTTNRQIRNTSLIPGDYAFPINLNYIDVDLQIDRFLHHGPTDFEGRLIAIDYERYGPLPAATAPPNHLKEYIRVLRKYVGDHPILMYAGKAFWEEPPDSGMLSNYGAGIHMWNPWYWSLGVREQPFLHYRQLVGDPETGWWESYGGTRPICTQFCIGRAAGIPLDINAWRIEVDAIEQLTRSLNG